MADHAVFKSEIEKLVASHALHGSESLCKLLRYLGKQAIDHPGVPVKEYQIATEVFGRQADFDPQLDSMVRVQAGRLRAKLTEYYSHEGVSDRLVVELPKGSYAIAFHERGLAASTTNNGAATFPGYGVSEHAEAPPTRSSYTVSALALALIFFVGLSGWLYWTRRDPVIHSASATPGLVPEPIRTFWTGAARGPEAPWVVFSNAAFIGRPDIGMRYADPAKDGNTPILDHYTGVGEVLAVHNLDLVFGSLQRGLRVKRGSLFSLDDAKNNDLIFIGSPSENLTLLEIPSTTQFVFQKVASGARAGNVKIVNTHPAKGEPREWLASPSNVPLLEDYSVVAYVKAIDPEHSELILAGTTTIGTQAAVEYVTRENYLSELLKKLNVAQPSDLKHFEAVIRTKVTRGVPVESTLVALRVLD